MNATANAPAAPAAKPVKLPSILEGQIVGLATIAVDGELLRHELPSWARDQEAESIRFEVRAEQGPSGPRLYVDAPLGGSKHQADLADDAKPLAFRLGPVVEVNRFARIYIDGPAAVEASSFALTVGGLPIEVWINPHTKPAMLAALRGETLVGAELRATYLPSADYADLLLAIDTGATTPAAACATLATLARGRDRREFLQAATATLDLAAAIQRSVEGLRFAFNTQGAEEAALRDEGRSSIWADYLRASARLESTNDRARPWRATDDPSDFTDEASIARIQRRANREEEARKAAAKAAKKARR